MARLLGDCRSRGNPVSWLRAVPIWAWACLGLAVLVLIQDARLSDVEAEYAGFRSDVAEAGRKAEAAEREKERAWNARIAEIEKDGQAKIRDLLADERDAVAALERMRRRAAEAERTSRACGNSITARLSASTGDAGLLPADMLEGLGEAARLYALEADRRGIAGRACEASYNAVRGKVGSR